MLFQPDEDEWYRRQFPRERWSWKAVGVGLVFGILFALGVIELLFRAVLGIEH